MGFAYNCRKDKSVLFLLHFCIFNTVCDTNNTVDDLFSVPFSLTIDSTTGAIMAVC